MVKKGKGKSWQMLLTRLINRGADYLLMAQMETVEDTQSANTPLAGKAPFGELLVSYTDDSEFLLQTISQ